jgi:hypothetical protein
MKASTMVPLLLLGGVAMGLLFLSGGASAAEPTTPPPGPQPGPGPGWDRQLGPWFWLRELVGDDGPPPPDVDARLQAVHDSILHPLRERLGRPLRVTSGYRSRAHDEAIGGAGVHPSGAAVDVLVEDMSSEELAATALQAGIPYGELVWYNAPDRHIHITLPGFGGNGGSANVHRKGTAGSTLPRPGLAA